jgi:signal transduction histidine kinase
MPVSGSGGGGSNSASSIRAGKAHVELSAKDKGIGPALEKMRKRILAFGKLTAKIGIGVAASTLPVVKAVSSFVDRGTEIKKIADRTGATTEAVSELAYTFEQVGLNIDNVADATKDLQNKLSKAKDGDGFSLALQEIGMNAEQLKGMKLEDQFDALADGISRVQNPADRTRLMLELLGGSGDKLTGIFSEGAAGLRRYREEAKLAGASMPKEEAEQAAAASKSLHAVLSALTYAFHSIGSAILPSADTIKEFTSDVLRVIKSIRDWVQENKRTVQIVGIVTAAVLGVGIALTGLGLVISTIATAAAGLVIAVKAIIAVFAAIISPIGLVVIGVTALAAGIIYLIAQTEEGSAALGRLLAYYKSLAQTAMQAFKGIADALAAGEFRLAWDITLKGLLVAWRTFVVELQKGWNWFKRWFVDSWHSVGEGITNIIVDIGEYVFTTFKKTILGIMGLLEKLSRKVGLNDIFGDLSVLEKIVQNPAIWEQIRGELGVMRKDAQDIRDAARNADLQVAKDELAQAKKELDELTERARLAREALKKPDVKAIAGGSSMSQRLPIIGDATRGAFSASNYKQIFAAGDSINQKQLERLISIDRGIGIVGDAVKALQANWKFS